ncbi:hypothetical protein ABCW43_24960 [Neorhizobium sp. IRAMC:178]|uniref:hypothetical protein n=1 Tax=Neorhizobium tunisiense TaxID=3144793 RepID=UPI0031F6D84F
MMSNSADTGISILPPRPPPSLSSVRPPDREIGRRSGEDPTEVCNLWSKPAHQATKQELITEILKWRIRGALKTQVWTLASVALGANSERTPVNNAKQGGE